jgi:hypothetical protein
VPRRRFYITVDRIDKSMIQYGGGQGAHRAKELAFKDRMSLVSSGKFLFNSLNWK